MFIVLKMVPCRPMTIVLDFRCIVRMLCRLNVVLIFLDGSPSLRAAVYVSFYMMSFGHNDK